MSGCSPEQRPLQGNVPGAFPPHLLHRGFSPRSHQRTESIHQASRLRSAKKRRRQRCVQPTHATHMSKTSTRTSSDYHGPIGPEVSLALHVARLASADFVCIGGGCWPQPLPTPLASGAPVTDRPLSRTTDQDRFRFPPRERRGLATIQNAFCQPGTRPRGPSFRRRSADGDLGVCSLG